LENGIVKLSHLALPSLLALLALPAERPLDAQAAKADAKALDWFQFRGPNRDGVASETGLLQQWPSGGPPLAWKATGIGTGYSSVCVSGTRLFTMGETGGKSFLLALNAADGKILWKTEVGQGGDPGNQGAGPRGTPATDGTLVFCLSQSGDLACAQAATGKLVWKKTMSQLGGGGAPGWGWSESPLLDGPAVVVSPGGSGGVVALNKATGANLWQAKVPGGAQYTSLAVADIGNIRQYLYFNMDTVAGIAARTGQVAWSIDRKGQTAIASVPVYKDGTVLVSSGYGVGHTAFRVAGAGGRFQVQKAYEGKEMASHHGGYVLVGDHVYVPSDGGSLVCAELKTGKVAWQDRCVGKGSAIAADGHLYVRGEGGGMALVEASPASYKEKGRFNLPKTGGNGAWANPAVGGGKLYLREWDNLYCYDIKAK
jgi:outer membrane protein assembly factor BamB